MKKLIDAGWVKLSEDSFDQSLLNFKKAIKVIDKEFGTGYARENPELISAFMQSSAIEYNGVIIAACLQQLNEGYDDLKNAVDRLAFQAETISNRI